MASSGHAAAEIEAVSAEDSFHDILLPATHDAGVVDLQADESAAQSRPSTSGKWTGFWRALTTGQHKLFAFPWQTPWQSKQLSGEVAFYSLGRS